RARRASLALLHRFGSSNYWVTLEGNYARGVRQYGFRDLNLVTTPRFTLPDEAGRPVYVPVDSIVPTTGAVSSVGARKIGRASCRERVYTAVVVVCVIIKTE